jgi:hypothetical protein
LAELGQIREALRREVQERAALARETYAQAREEGADRVRAGLAALRAAAQRQGIGEGPTHGRDEDDARQHRHEREADSIKGRLARILERPTDRHEAEVVREPGPGHGREDVRERLGRILGREAPGPTQAEPGADVPLTHGIRERLHEVLARTKPVTREEPERGLTHDEDEPVHRHRDDGWSHGL